MTDAERKAASAAALSMRDRASRAALRRGVVPCQWLSNAISQDIENLSLLEENVMANQPQQGQQPAQAQGAQGMQAQAQALGIDLSKIDWAKIAQAVQFFLSLLQQHGPAMASAAPAEHKGTCERCLEAACLAMQAAHVSLTCGHECHGG